MKKIKSILLGIVIVVFLASCGGGSGSVKSNKYLKDLPKMAAEILEPKFEIAKLNEKLDGDISEKKMMKIINERDELAEKYEKNKDEMMPKLKEYAENEMGGKEIPCEVASDVETYTIESVEIDEKQEGWLKLKANVNVSKELGEYELFEVYFKFVDEEGNELFTEKSTLGYKDHKKGKASTMYIRLSLIQIYQLEEFDKVVGIKS